MLKPVFTEPQFLKIMYLSLSLFPPGFLPLFYNTNAQYPFSAWLTGELLKQYENLEFWIQVHVYLYKCLIVLDVHFFFFFWGLTYRVD